MFPHAPLAPIVVCVLVVRNIVANSGDGSHMNKRTDPVHRSSHTRWGLGRDYRNLVLPLLQCNAERLVRTQDLLAQVGRTSPLRQACPPWTSHILYKNKKIMVICLNYKSCISSSIPSCVSS